MSIITVSRETGSLGDETARLLAENLRYKLLDRAAMEKTIDGEKFPDIPLDRFDEHSPSFWENFTTGKDIYLDRLRTAMLESASSGHIV
ncbi:MAG: cytidylate kinase family protein, partial [Spirochaetaceae bacterium]|nr:cytidylate kinase family protein [Spirochaetaceae bacterium]